MKKILTIIAATLVAAACLTACSDDPSARTYSKAEHSWAESHCEITVGLNEYENPEGWDRCVADNLPDAKQGIKDAKTFVDAENKALDDPRCKTYDNILDCMDDFDLDPNDPSYVVPVKATADQQQSLPSCNDIWIDTVELPKPYVGCVRLGEFIRPSFTLCSGNSKLFVYNDEGITYYAFEEGRYPSIVGDGAEIGRLTKRPAIITARDVCAE